MIGRKQILISFTVALAAAGFSGCSPLTKLTDPTYEYLTLLAVDGKPLPTSIRLGPDSLTYPVRSGRLGLPDASISLPCRLQIQIGYPTSPAEALGSANDATCVRSGDLLTVTTSIGYMPNFTLLWSGAHAFTFGPPLIREK